MRNYPIIRLLLVAFKVFFPSLLFFILQDDKIVLLTVPKSSSSEVQRPQMQVVRCRAASEEESQSPPHPGYAELSADVLSIRHHDRLKARDYQLESLYEEGVYFVLSPRDVIVGKPRDADDHVDWLMGEAQKGSRQWTSKCTSQEINFAEFNFPSCKVVVVGLQIFFAVLQSFLDPSR